MKSEPPKVADPEPVYERPLLTDSCGTKVFAKALRTPHRAVPASLRTCR